MLTVARPGHGRARVARLRLAGPGGWVAAALRGEQVWTWCEVVERWGGDLVATLEATYEGQSDGTAVTTANSDDFGDTALAAVTLNSGTANYETSQASHGSVSVQVTPSSTNSVFVQYTDGATSTSGAMRIYLYMTGSPSGTVDFPIRFVSSSNSTVATIQMTSGRLLRISAGSSVQGTVALALNTWHRIEVEYDAITGGSGTIDCRSYTGDGTSATDTIGLTGLTLSAIQGIRLGKLTSGSVTLAGFYVDSFKWVSGSATPLGPFGQDATPTPSAVSRSAVIPAPTVQTGQTISATAVSRSAVIPAPTVSTGITTSPAAVAALATIWPFEPTVDSTIDVAAISRLVGIPPPVLSASVTLNPDTLAGRATSVGNPVLPNYLIAFDADASDVSIGAHVMLRDSGGSLRENTVFVVTDKQSFEGFTNIFVDQDFAELPVVNDYLQVTPTSMPARIPEPTITHTATVAATAVAAPVAVPEPTITATATLTPASVAAVATAPAPTVTCSATVTPASVAAVAAVPDPGLQTGTATTVNPAAVVGVAAVPAPSLVTDQTITATVVSRAAVVPAPTVSVGTTVAPSAVSAVTAVQAPTVQTGVTITPSSVASPSINVPQPDLSTSHVVTVSTIAGVVAMPAATLKMSADVTPVSVFGFASQVPVTVFAQASQTVTPSVVAAVAAVPAPDLAMSTEPTGVAASGTAAVPAPTISCSATLNAFQTVAGVASIPRPNAQAKRAGGSLQPAGGANVRRLPTLTGGVR